jgi:uncharacterized protein
MSFLTGEWKNLLIVNYAIDPALLEKYVPHHTVLDLWNDTCYASLVGFMFQKTKLLGVPIPFHTDFEEVNLRFYVKYLDQGYWKRGVVFIKELVPKPALVFVANALYKEHYQTAKMAHAWKETDKELDVTYSWTIDRAHQHMKARAESLAMPIAAGSEAEFITEHYWGYTKVNDTKTFEYGVTHPKWKVFPIIDYEVKVDFEKVYGPDFKSMNGLTPCSVMLAAGSSITVENKRTL